MTNDLDVHVALLSAPSYQKHMDEKYYDNQKTTAQCCRQYVDLFGMLQKVPNALGKFPFLFHNTSLFTRHVY